MRPGGVSAWEVERASGTLGPLFRYPEPGTRPYRGANRMIETLPPIPTEGRVAVIVGTGPQVKDFDFRQLNSYNYVTFAINDAWLKFRPNYWVVNDIGVVDKFASHYVDPSITFVTNQVNLGLSMGRFQSGKHKQVNRANSCLHRAYFYNQARSADIDALVREKNKVFIRHTTATAAASVAMKLGLRKIVLLGVDMCYQEPGGYYGGTRRKWGEERDEEMLKKSKRHGEVWQTSAQENMCKQFEELQINLRTTGLKIYQTQLVSPVEVEKIPWESVPCLF